VSPGLPAKVAAVVAAGRLRGVPVEPREFPDGTRTAADAAAAIGVEVAQIVKSLAFLVDGRPVMALVSGSNRLDEARLAEAAGGTEVARAAAGLVREATGFAIGGVPPFGHAAAMPCFVDEDLLRWDVVWAAAGTPRHVFPIAPADLVRATGGTVCRLS
jgi:prolyl-tRNA editing enzyme YbaK/EbsC (Cys-tRNA(Pro) deacylase)